MFENRYTRDIQVESVTLSMTTPMFPNNEQAQQAYDTLLERGSLAELNPQAQLRLTPQILKWLLWAESHEGSEIVFMTENGKARGIPVSSFLNYPETYEAKMSQGAFVSTELKDGSSVVLYFESLTKPALELALKQLEKKHADQEGLEGKILKKLEDSGHLNHLTPMGQDKLNSKLLKYLDYAVNIRPGSEIIYMDDLGSVRGDSLERALALPHEYEDIQTPVFLAIDIEEFSVVMDLDEVTPEGIIDCLQQAYEIAAENT